MEHSIAKLDLPSFAATLALDHPAEGMSLAKPFTSSGLPGARVFRISIRADSAPASPQYLHSYIRGNDLVAAYEDASTSIRAMIYWRLVTLRNLTGIEWIMCVETSRLNCDLEIVCDAELPDADLNQALRANYPMSVVCEWPHAEFAYAEQCASLAGMAPTVSNVLRDGEPRSRIRWKLVQERIEKGVIRVAQIRMLAGGLGELASQWDEAYHDFLRAEPAITA